MNNTLSTRVAELRKEADLTLSALSRAVDLSASYLSQLESGNRAHPSLDSLEKLASFYGVERAWLLEGQGEKLTKMNPVLADAALSNVLEQINNPDGEWQMREARALAEIEVRLAQATHARKKTWAIHREAIIKAVDDYAEYCFEHNATLRAASIKSGRAAFDARHGKRGA